MPSVAAHLYDARWRKAAKAFLRRHPLCVYCQRDGRLTGATVVDHITPHKGNQELFWDERNWQGLCKPHHDGAKQAEERRGYSGAIGEDGWPVDPRHPANRSARW